MRYLLTLILPLSLLVLQGCDQLQTPRDSLTGSGSSAAPAGPVMATVNGTALTKPVFEAYAAQRRAAAPGGEGSDDATILDELINLELMRQEGVNKGLEARPAVAALLDQVAAERGDQRHLALVRLTRAQHHRHRARLEEELIPNVPAPGAHGAAELVHGNGFIAAFVAGRMGTGTWLTGESIT